MNLNLNKFLSRLNPVPINFGACWLCCLRAELTAGLCQTCYGDLPRLAPQPLVADHEHTRMWLAALAYQQPVERWIHDFKFNGISGLSRHMAPLLAAQAVKVYQREQIYLPEVLVPVPLSERRWFHRGYNQSQLLAAELSKILSIPLQEPLNKRHTGENHRLTASQRRRNLAEAFYWREPLLAKRVAIVDDVITSGATVEAMAAVLRQENCIVDAWGLAYTPPPT